MAHKIAIALIVLALFGGAYGTASPQSFTATTSSFVFAPTTSHAAATAVDSANLIGVAGWAAYASSATDGQAWLYQLGKLTDTTTAISTLAQPTNAAACSGTTCYVYKLFSRKLYSANFTTFGTNGVAAPATSDAAQSTTYTYNTPSMVTSTIDQFAWVSIYTDATPEKFVQICVALSAGAPVCKSKTSGANTAVTVHSFFCDSVSKNCYALVGSVVSAAVVYKVYGVTSAGAEVWTAGFVTVGTQGAISATARGVVFGNTTNSTLNTIINVAYLDGAAGCLATGVCTTKFTTVSTAAATTATVPATPITVTTSTATAGYSPCGYLIGNSSNALLLCFQNKLESETPTVCNITAVFNPSQKTAVATTDLQYLNVSKLDKPFVWASGSYYGSGFFMVSIAGGSSSYSAYYNTYNGTGYNLTNGGLTLGTGTATGAMGSWFISANSSLGYGWVNYDATEADYVSTSAGAAASTAGRTTSSMAGGIANSMYAGASSGNTLACFVAFVAFTIASLFAF